MQPDDDKTRTHVTLSGGTTVSHYRIVEKIGAGGMGEVYLAEDTNLNRQIAIKVLPDMFGGDQERLARFEREAKLLASLNHPNLATIHGLENVQGKRLLVMELVEGETLAERIAKGPLPFEEALEVFRQLAAGMEAAHEKGIIHRDLKPANIKITPEGKVKILDFGLAKALQGESAASDLANSPTITENMTRAGVILGTAAYMSPEQAKGRPVDKRTDIWAFGCIVYECLTGTRAFEGETTSETLAAVLRGEPDWQKLPVQTPSHIKNLLRRCLQKDASRRLRDIGDALPDESDSSLMPSDMAAKNRHSWRVALPWAVAALLFVTTAYLMYAGGGGQSVKEVPIISHILPPANAVSCFRDGFALSPDGRKLAFASLSSKGERLVWVRHLDRQEAVPLAGTDDGSYPFWSPDGKQIAFYAGGKLKRVASDGGPVQVICAASNRGSNGSSWGNAGIILFSNTWGGISSVSDGGGEPTGLFLEEAYLPCFLPDGRRFLYVNEIDVKPIVYIASLDKPGSEKGILGTSGAARVEWVPPDRLVLWRSSDRTLVTQRVDIGSRNTLGPPTLLAERVPTNDWPFFSTSPTGTLAFVVNPPDVINSQASRLIWVDRKGGEVGRLGDMGGYWNLRISPDGKRVAVNPDEDVWIFDVATGMPTRLTNEVASGNFAFRPIWSPKGDSVLARGWRDGAHVLKEYPVSGGQPREVYRGPFVDAGDWSPDGRYLALTLGNRQSITSNVAYFDLADSQLKPFVATPAHESAPEFSPDGRWIAYVSNETGAFEVYVRSFPGGEQFRRVSYAGGMHPRWRADGREMFFLAPGWTLMAADVTLEPTLEIGTPTALFQMVMADILKGLVAPYDVSPDGQRFLVISPQTKPVPLTLVQHWTGLLDR